MRRPLLTPVLVAVAALGLVLAGCEKEKKARPSVNQSPKVEITGGAAENQADDYKVEFFWFGYDPDGEIDHFQLSVDDTVFAPTDTTSQFSRSVRFVADSLSAGSGSTVNGDFHRWHRFYVRAVDDKGAVSAMDRRTFNAFTIAPVTHFLLPVGGGRISQFSQTVRFKWTGQDDDSSQPDRKPVGYRYKLVHVDNLLDGWATHAIQDSLGDLHDDGTIDPRHSNINWAWPDSVLRNPAISDSIKKEWIQIRPSTIRGDVQYWDPVNSTWLDIPGDLEQVRFEGLELRGYAFSVRAVDEANAVEPDYVRHLDANTRGNVFIFEAINLDSKPKVTVFESTLGSFTCPTQGNSIEWEVPANKELRFGWRADADFYGGEIQGFNYGLDIPDPSSEMQQSGGIGGWIGWGMWSGNITPIIFPPSDDGVIHNFYVKARDTRGGTTTALIKLKVVAFPFDKKILIIDDFANYQGSPTDYDQDTFNDRILRRRFAYADSGEITWINGLTASPTAPEPPPPPTLSFLSRYKMVIMYLQESGTNSGDFSVTGNLTSADNPTNARHNPKRRALATYVGAGGNVWVWGIAMTGGLQGDNYRYPKEPRNDAGQETANPELFDSNSFLYSMLHITRGVIQINGDVTSANVMFGAVPGVKAAERGYPAIDIDRARFPNEQKGINQAEVIQGAPLIVAGMDTLYTYKAKGTSSLFNHRPTALLYKSPVRPKVQGDVAYFGFYYYFMMEDQMTAMCDRVFDDFFTEQ